MKRFVTRSATLWDHYLNAEDYLGKTVFEPDPTPRPTGLLDAGGNKICVVEELDQIGFVRKVQ
jgi:hypothetical protein